MSKYGNNNLTLLATSLHN